MPGPSASRHGRGPGPRDRLLREQASAGRQRTALADMTSPSSIRVAGQVPNLTPAHVTDEIGGHGGPEEDADKGWRRPW